ncbi:endo alpha-1,4 polygalactosaminidase [Microbulbifer sp. MLAF003]|uniref:endo alpha-1,4 polygalactosaminidase n=1 Tax=Microbulbifer sp. MLAF003 TaxID=3032582 RepID=UPI0024AD4E53|nr:endo alpha-1,4 polygalactosaminidase [Microbulbifer sp. MLAF003]WHI49467.1 endo alpha-1,4 polygalactosaminidase [Microbulbifer sp. MLAF003]
MHRTLPFLLSPFLLLGCSFDDLPDFVIPVYVDYDQEMRYLVEDISDYAKGINRDDFIIVPQNGIELITTNTKTNGPVDNAYVNSTDGIAQEAVFFGQNGDVDQPTSSAESARLQDYLNLAKDKGREILVTDFAYTERNIDESNQENEEAGYVSFVADDTDLDDIPPYPEEPFNVNSNNIDELENVKNFLNITNPRISSTRQEFVDKLSETDYDLLVIDFFFNGEEYTEEQIEQLKVKNNGGRRLLIAYINIGEAQDSRYYWDPSWPTNPPSWLLEEVPGESGNYYVEYWKEGWQNIIYGNNDSYIYKIVDAGFDGAYMDGIDVYDYFDSLDTEEGN